jgi:hypothetical protein
MGVLTAMKHVSHDSPFTRLAFLGYNEEGGVCKNMLNLFWSIDNVKIN